MKSENCCQWHHSREFVNRISDTENETLISSILRPKLKQRLGKSVSQTETQPSTKNQGKQTIEEGPMRFFTTSKPLN